MSDTERVDVDREAPAWQATIKVYRTKAARQILVAEKSGRGVMLSKQWDVTPGKPVASQIVDMVTWIQKSLVDFFTTWGRI